MFSKFAYYCVVYPISKLPLHIIYLFSDFLYIVFLIFPYRKRVIVENLNRSFPEKTKTERRIIRRQFYRHFADLMAEGIKNLSISKRELQKRYRIKNPQIIEELYKKNKSVIIVSGHYNNWEWLISAQNFMFSHQAMGIGMPMSSKFWDRKVNERRQRFGMIVVHSKNFREEIEKLTTVPKAILTLFDQSPGNSLKSYWMQFLNQTTAVLFGAELMAHQYNFAVVFYHTKKIKRGVYEMTLNLITEEPKSKKWGEITEECTKKLEKEIIKNPQYWLWSHKRWKREIPNNLEELKKQQKQDFHQKLGR